MRAYFLRRFGLWVPTLLVVSLLAFALQEAAPGDPVSRFLREDAAETGAGTEADQALRAWMLARAVAELGADKPAFYLGLRPLSLPDTLHRVLPLARRRAYADWCRLSGNHRYVQAWYDQLDRAAQAVVSLEGDKEAIDLRRRLAEWRQGGDPHRMAGELAAWPEGLLPAERAATVAALPPTGGGWRNWIPVVDWHGIDNRYHRWLTQWGRASGQRSWQDGQPVWRRIRQAASWTLLMNGLAILLAYGISIPLGVWMASRAGSGADQRITLLLYGLYALPAFWLGTLLLLFFTGPTYGMPLFPGIGVGDIPPGAGWWEIWQIRAGHLFLPVFCLTYGSLAFLTRQVRNAVVQEMKKDYVRTAWAKGLSRRQVVWRHAFRNALFPLITLLAQVLPAALAGSVAIEVIFNIPGMGRLSYQAILAQDWPLVYGILFLGAVLTLAGSLLADFLYGLADPRVRLGHQTGA